MDKDRSEVAEQLVARDKEIHEDVFVRQVDDRALPAPQVLAEHQVGMSGRISGPLFIP